MVDSKIIERPIESSLTVHRCIYCIGHKRATLVIEENLSYYKSPKPRWVKCECPDCHFSMAGSGFTDNEAVTKWNNFCEREAAFGQAVLASFQASHRGLK